MPLPDIGSTPPAFTLPNQHGENVSLADFAGKNVLIWFYPRAFGNGWTKQANGFRDRIQQFAEKNTVLLGITFSPQDDLKSWAEEVGLDSHLLCDAGRKVAMAYGAADDPAQERPKRMSVLVGPDGKVVNTYATPDAATHPAEVLAELA